MYLSRFDFLSSPITLYYNGGLEHTSIPSVFMSLIGYAASIIIGLMLSIDFFKRKNPTVFYFNRYVEDSGIYPLNSQMVFSYFQMVNTSDNTPRAIDFTALRVIGTELSIQTYLERSNITRDDHWIYDQCDNGTDIEGLQYLYDYSTFNQSYCIKKYYKADEKKYYKVGDDKFRWPHTDHGTSHPNKTFYGIVFENCKNDEVQKEINGGKPCKSISEIKKYVDKNYVRFYMIDHYPDVYNYKKPFTKYFYNIDTTLASGSYTYNHINFNPSKIITNNGLFFDNEVVEQAYMFDQNAQQNGLLSENYEDGVYYSYLAYYFWLKNTMFIYNRTYKRVQDVLAEIEAMMDVIIFAATIVNYFISDYVTLNDTIHVLFSLKSKKVNQSQINRVLQSRKRTMFQNNAPPRRNNAQFNYYYGSSKNNEENSERVGMDPNHQRLGNNKPSRRGENISYQRAPDRTSNNQLLRNKGNQANSGVTYVRGNNQIRDKNTMPMDVDVYKNPKTVQIKEEKGGKEEKDDNENVVPDFDPFKEKKLSISEFLVSYVFFCKKNENIEAYENFRMKIISEENLIQNYLDIHTLTKSAKNEINNFGGLGDADGKINQ